MSPEQIKHSEYSKVVALLFSNKYNEFEDKILELDKNRKSSLFVDMFIQKDLENLNLDNKKLYTGIINIFKITNLVKEGIYDKKMSFLGINPTYKYFSLAFELILKIREEESLIKKIMKNKDLLFSDKVSIFQRYKKYESRLSEVNISEKLFSKFKMKIKKKLSSLSFLELQEDKYGRSLIYRMKELELPLDKISEELNRKIYKSKNDFFEVLEFFKYWQQSSSGNKYMLDKELMVSFFNLNDIDKYIEKEKKNFIEKEKELIEIYRRDKWD